jgi:ElaA protein
MKWSFKAYDELKLSELYALLELRVKVFVVEQNCVYQDLDGNDLKAIHLLCFQKKKLIAYSRIFGPGAFEKKHVRIGRIVTQKQSRGKDIGYQLVQKSIMFCKEHFANSTIKISAQVYLKNFYNRCGFVEKGKTYFEDGIPHCAMYFNGAQ